MSTFSLDDVRHHQVAPGSIALWSIGQSGFLIQSTNTILVMDPYLTNSCKAIGDILGLQMDRMIPPPIQPEELAGVDGYLMTHSHQDHLDPETLAGYRAAGGQGPYVGPAETYEKLESLGVPQEEIKLIWPNKEHVIGDFTIRATFAIPLGPDDLTHVGYLIGIEGGPKFYFTGDTAYHDLLPASVLPHKPDVLVTVINPCFRNMGPPEAARLARELDVKIAIPCHFDMFLDNYQPPQIFRTNLLTEGIIGRYRVAEIGTPYVFPEATSESSNEQKARVPFVLPK